jgi:hypothetical protein
MKDNHHIKDLDTSSQLKWCDSLLSKSKAKWKFVFGHHPAYSAGGKHGSTIEMQNSFVPMFEKYHVDAVFSGHDHDLQHSKPEGSTVDYFGVGGGSGARITSQGSFSKFCISSLGFGVVSVTSKEFRISFINKTGEVLYQYDKKK